MISKKAFRNLFRRSIFYIWKKKISDFFFRYKYRQKTIKIDVFGYGLSFSTKSTYSKHAFLPKFLDGYVYEPPVSKLLIEQLTDKKSFLDIGSNVGYFSMLANRVMENGKIQAFEMDPFLCNEFRTNSALNPSNNSIIIHNIGIGSKKGKLYGVASRAGHPLRFITPNKPSYKFPFNFGKSSIINIDAIDNLVNENVDVVKIDIEGAELEALKGMVKLIESCKPKLFLEVHPRGVLRFGNTMNDITQFLKDYDYEIFEISTFKNNSSESEYKELVDLSSLKEATMLYCV